MKVAILGASSQIAQDLIKFLREFDGYELFLFGRQTDTSKGFKTYEDFNTETYDALINFVGVGDPARAVAMGPRILDVTEHFDSLALNYLKLHPNCRYVFLSSGAALGSDFQKPADANTTAKFPINSLSQQDWYGIAKFYTEAKHRAFADLPIVDVRVFNYLSSSQTIESRFMVTDALRTIRDGAVFRTNPLDLVRDFLSAQDFFNLVASILRAPACNVAVDCYSIAPVKKFDLLNALAKQFCLRYEVIGEIDSINATGVKLHYYSTNHNPAKLLGYTPTSNSLDNVLSVSSVLLDSL